MTSLGALLLIVLIANGSLLALSLVAQGKSEAIIWIAALTQALNLMSIGMIVVLGVR